MVGRGAAIECDNCKATGSLGRVKERRGGREEWVHDVRSYWTISKVRGHHDVEKFETLHFCTLECLVEHAPKLATNV